MLTSINAVIHLTTLKGGSYLTGLLYDVVFRHRSKSPYEPCWWEPGQFVRCWSEYDSDESLRWMLDTGEEEHVFHKVGIRGFGNHSDALVPEGVDLTDFDSDVALLARIVKVDDSDMDAVKARVELLVDRPMCGVWL